jgi:hypothetical protein
MWGLEPSSLDWIRFTEAVVGYNSLSLAYSHPALTCVCNYGSVDQGLHRGKLCNMAL